MARQAGTAETSREDYALRRIPSTWTWSWLSINMVILGVGTAMAQFTLGGSLAIGFGTGNAIIGAIWGLLAQGFLSFVLIKRSAQQGLNVDLLSRGMGFGFMGSAITSVIYWLAYTTFYIIEGTVMGSAISTYTGLPIQVSFAIIGIVFIPLTIWGMVLLEKFQTATFIIFAILVIAAIVQLTNSHTMLAHANGWLSFGANKGKVTFIGALGAIAAINGLVGANVIVGIDIARFAPKGGKNLTRNAVFTAFIPLGIFLYAMMVLGMWFAAGAGTFNPGIYMVHLIGFWGFLFIVFAQLRIGLDIFYGGSVCLANFFSRTLRLIWGRKWWAVLMVIASTLLLYLGLMKYINIMLTIMGAYILAWIGILLSDSVILRGIYKFGTDSIEYRRPYLPDFNQAGVIALIIGTVVGIFLAFGGIGHYLSGFLVDISGIVAFFLGAIIYVWVSIAKKGKGYIKQPVVAYTGTEETERCPVCHEIVATVDLIPCPDVKVWLCSQCCMRNRTCNDSCAQKGLIQDLPPLPSVDVSAS